MVSYTNLAGTFNGDGSTYTVAPSPSPLVIRAHPDDRKHFTPDDMQRLADAGYVVLFATRPIVFDSSAFDRETT